MIPTSHSPVLTPGAFAICVRRRAKWQKALKGSLIIKEWEKDGGEKGCRRSLGEHEIVVDVVAAIVIAIVTVLYTVLGIVICCCCCCC